MPFFSQALEIKVPCRCGRWEFREAPMMAGALAPFAASVRCPRCKADALLVFRIGFGREIYLRHLGTVYVAGRGRSTPEMEEALRTVPGLTDDERELMMATARLWTAQRMKPTVVGETV